MRRGKAKWKGEPVKKETAREQAPNCELAASCAQARANKAKQFQGLTPPNLSQYAIFCAPAVHAVSRPSEGLLGSIAFLSACLHPQIEEKMTTARDPKPGE